MAHDVYDAVKEGMSGNEKPPKEIHHIHIRKVHGGNHIVEHHHTHPAHNMEEHTTQGTDGLVDHVMQHMTDQNVGEAEADAGQSGIPPAAQTPLAAATGGAQTA
jgi:hypothetical protein